jgi:hypothetical protein
MRIRKLAAAAALGVAALGLSACATGLNTQVSRFQPAQIVLGQSFYVVPASGIPDNRFHRYASMVSQQLAAQGFQPAGAPQLADMLVKVDYGVDEGTTEIRDEPYFYPGYSRLGYGGYGGFYGRPFYSRWGGYPFYYGWDDPFSYGSPYSSRLTSYTVYKSRLDVDIVRRADNAPLFEGHAQARSRSDELDKLVPSLVTAMFTGFPGRNGETVRITVPTTKTY